MNAKLVSMATMTTFIASMSIISAKMWFFHKINSDPIFFFFFNRVARDTDW